MLSRPESAVLRRPALLLLALVLFAAEVARAQTAVAAVLRRNNAHLSLSTAGGPTLSTHPALVKAICDGLQAAGLPRSQIIIWDKFQDRMRPAGYALRGASPQQPAVESIVPANNYDPDVYYSNGLLGNLIWGDFLFRESLDGFIFFNFM